ncbi:hypothetical protein T265_03825 [Opisthorchis viverrini]|uniref:Uncharacterized protein n=1 Tax=Opisthorchis viverrini TaxID=6198 RepID=A0A074ZUV7_OPIVI|nr:hypothetical protein T265_03825 [Opisthorchis viverrini]KER29627.1 hypothetical protein T265_03825 [Opisthorchis viverrini]
MGSPSGAGGKGGGGEEGTPVGGCDVGKLRGIGGTHHIRGTTLNRGPIGGGGTENGRKGGPGSPYMKPKKLHGNKIIAPRQDKHCPSASGYQLKEIRKCLQVNETVSGLVSVAQIDREVLASRASIAATMTTTGSPPKCQASHTNCFGTNMSVCSDVIVQRSTVAASNSTHNILMGLIRIAFSYTEEVLHILAQTRW